MRKVLSVFIAFTIYFEHGYCIEAKQEIDKLDLSSYVTLSFDVPETHADIVREAMGRAGAGQIGNYSYCSYSIKGIGRFIPNKGSNPYLGKEDVMAEIVEEHIQTICSLAILENVLEEIKKAHPYEELIIDIFPVYEIGRKKAKVQLTEIY